MTEQREFRTRFLPLAAYLIAVGAPFPGIEGEKPKNAFTFDDPSGEWQAAAREFDHGDEESCCVPARRLFESEKLLRAAVHGVSTS